MKSAVFVQVFNLYKNFKNGLAVIYRRMIMENNLDSGDYESKFRECHARFDAIFELTTVASKIIDSELTILKVNQALTELLGYSAEELVGRKILDYACQEDKQHWHRLQEAMWHQGKANFKLDACIIKKDGTLAWVHVTTIAFKENGVSYAFTVLDEYTAWKKLQESEQRLSMALKYSKMAVWELDLATGVINRSDGFDQLFGYSQKDAEWNQDRLMALFLPRTGKNCSKCSQRSGPGRILISRAASKQRTASSNGSISRAERRKRPRRAKGCWGLCMILPVISWPSGKKMILLLLPATS